MMIPHKFISAFQRAKSCLVLTGAGVSAESGLETFRGQQGLWDGFDPLTLATPQAFAQDPKRVWEWYQWRREKLPLVKPNPAHKAIAEMESYFDHFLLVTQNIDGLHQRAGSIKMVELHGNLNRNKCSECGALVDILPPSEDIPPRCACGGLVRPDVVWFGETLPEEALRRAWQAAAAADLFLSVGTSAEVQPAASLGLVAGNNGALLVEVNTALTEFSDRADIILQGPAGQIMPGFVKQLALFRQGVK